MTARLSALLETELKQQEEQFGSNDARLQQSIEKLADQYLVEHDLEAAIRLYERESALPGVSESAKQLTMEKLLWLSLLKNDKTAAMRYLDALRKNQTNEKARLERIRAHVAIYQGDLLAAQESLKAWLQWCPTDDVDYCRAWCLLCLAAVSHAMEQPAEAKQFNEAALTIIKDKCAVGYAVDYLSLAEIVNLYLFQERFQEALDVAACTLLEHEDSRWAFNPLAGHGLARLADYFRGQRKFKQAESVYKRSLAIKDRISDKYSTEYGDTCFSLATMYMQRKRFDETEPLLKAALKARVRTFGVEHAATAAAIETYAGMLRSTNRASLAGKLEGRAREIRCACVARFDKSQPR